MKKFVFLMIGVLSMSIMSCGNKTPKCTEDCADSVEVVDTVVVDSVAVDSVTVDTVVAE